MRRRMFLKMLPAAGVANVAAAAPDPSDWGAWKAAFLTPEGRAVDALQGMASHSEGQGWALLLASRSGDAQAAARIFDWTERHLAVRQDPLLSWRWRPGEGVVDYNNASDGDLFYAWALLDAARRFGVDAYADRAGQVARAIDQILVRDAPDGGLLLRPAAENFTTPAGEIVNPSYTMPLALHALGAAFDLPRLGQVADDGERMIARIAATGLVPDWVVLEQGGWRPAASHGPFFGYDAVRVALYLVWSGRFSHPAVDRAGSLYGDASNLAPVRVDPATSEVKERSDQSGYAAVAALVNGVRHTAAMPALPTFTAAQPYYPATLHLLTILAAEVSAPAGSQGG